MELKLYRCAHCGNVAFKLVDKGVPLFCCGQKMDELVPMSRIMTAPNVTNVCYDTAYMANISEVQLFYPTSILYVDGI